MIGNPGGIRPFNTKHRSFASKPEHVESLIRLNMPSTEVGKEPFRPGLPLKDGPAGLHHEVGILAWSLARWRAHRLGMIATEASGKSLDPATVGNAVLLRLLLRLQEDLAFRIPALNEGMGTAIGRGGREDPADQTGAPEGLEAILILLELSTLLLDLLGPSLGSQRPIPVWVLLQVR